MKKTPIFLKCKEGACILQIVQGDDLKIMKRLGESFQKLDTLMTEGAGEKHLPVVECGGNKVTVQIGSVLHPMTGEHSIDWVYLETERGGQCMQLDKTGEPKACFAIAEGDKAVAAYAYCNQHGLWKADILVPDI